jgi:hypothetical protein
MIHDSFMHAFIHAFMHHQVHLTRLLWHACASTPTLPLHALAGMSWPSRTHSCSSIRHSCHCSLCVRVKQYPSATCTGSAIINYLFIRIINMGTQRTMSSRHALARACHPSAPVHACMSWNRHHTYLNMIFIIILCAHPQLNANQRMHSMP